VKYFVIFCRSRSESDCTRPDEWLLASITVVPTDNQCPIECGKRGRKWR
jgi:hypothetical protein